MSSSCNYSFKPRKLVAKPFMGFVATALYISTAVGVINVIYNLVKGKSPVSGVICAVVSLVILGVFKFFFDWFKAAEVSVKNYDEVVYTEHGILKVSGNDAVKYKVSDITSVIVRPYEILVEGSVTYIDETKKSHLKSKFKILGVCDNREELIEKLNSMKDNGDTK